MKFQWNENKRKRNLAKHNIDFVLAALVFFDLDRIERNDHRKEYGEIRKQTIGKAKGIIVFVVYTIRKDVIRIISARRANRNERQQYIHDQRST